MTTEQNHIELLFQTIRTRGKMATEYEKIIMALISDDEVAELTALNGLREIAQKYKTEGYDPDATHAQYVLGVSTLELFVKVSSFLIGTKKGEE